MEGTVEQRVVPYEERLKSCNIISSPMASEKLNAKILKLVRKGERRWI